jgi:hypothetical protein
MPPPSSGMTLMISILAWAAALWIVVALITVGGRWQLSRPLRKQLA